MTSAAAHARPALAGPRAALYRGLAARFPTRPTRYAATILGVGLTADQVAIGEDLLKPPYRLLVPSANGVGKTFAAGWLVNWFHDSFDPGIVLATSSTFRQVRNQLFKEVRRLRPGGLDLMPRAPEVFHHGRHFALGFNTNRPDSFQGTHEAAFLLVMDEATGVPGPIADRAETMFKGVPGHAWVCFYNPNDPTTWPYAAEQSGGWAVRRLSALDHPNVALELRGEEPKYPGAVRLKRVLDRIARECEDCGTTKADDTCFEFPAGSNHWYKPVKPEFNPQVRGRWPSQATNAVWAEGDWARCRNAPDLNPDWPVQVGCDVARFGTNRTAIAVRWGTCLVHLEAHTHWPTKRISYHIAERLRALCHRYGRASGQDPKDIPCCVDDSGGYGSGVVDYPEGYNFVRVVAAEVANEPEKYPNKRSELWFTTRLAADEGGFFVGHCREGADLLDQLGRELTAVRYSLDKKGRRVVEGKSQMVDRLGVSPDLADALNLAYFAAA